MSKELKTGIVAIVIIALFIFGYNFLKKQNLLGPSSRTFFIEYSNIQGLSEKSIVTINGLNVGNVDQIRFSGLEDKKGRLVVKILLTNDFQFSKNSFVKIYSPSPLGGSNLAIVPNYEGEIAISGDTLRGKIESNLFDSLGSKLDPIQSKLNRVLFSADSLMIGLNQVFDKKARTSLNRSILGLEGAVSTISKTLSSVNTVLASNETNLNATLTNSKKITDNLSKVSTDIAKADLGKTVKKLETTLENVNTLVAGIKNGKGSLGKLVADEKLYRNLTNASKELENLLREMKLNPKRFVHFSLFGKKAKPYNKEKNQQNISN